MGGLRGLHIDFTYVYCEVNQVVECLANSACSSFSTQNFYSFHELPVNVKGLCFLDSIETSYIHHFHSSVL